MLSGRESRISEINARLAQLEYEKQLLWEELKSLQCDVVEHRVYGTPASETVPSTVDSRIALFCKLFRCRKDVFPIMWENAAKGTRGYSPACKNEWLRGVCNKPKIKCTNCLHRDFIPLDESVIRRHLEGKITIGTYTIRDDDTCTFLSADFDKENWQQDVLAYKKAGKEFGINIAVERSRSGNGAHAWIFFQQPIQAQIARRLGTIILTRAISERCSIALESYDRFFPSQDTIPKGGFGNLIALPLQRLLRKHGNTVFVDDDFSPYPDQWSYLAGTHLLSNEEASEIIDKYLAKAMAPDETNEAEVEHAATLLQDPTSRLENIYQGKVTVEFSQYLAINIADLPSKLIAALKRLATFANPKFYEAQRLRFSSWNIPRYICCAELNGDSVTLPRGLYYECLDLLGMAGAKVILVDKRHQYSNISVSFNGELLPDQVEAFKTLSNKESGVFVAPPGSGKTVIACSLIAERKLPTLILVHRKQLVEQWKARLTEFLNLDKKSIGVFGGVEKKRTGIIDIGMLQTISKMKNENHVIDRYGLVIIDECHHVPAISFESVLKKISALHFIGLTATPFRKDGHQAIIHMQCGPIVSTMAETQAQTDLVKKVIIRETNFCLPADAPPQPAIHQIWEWLVQDQDRLRLVAMDVIESLKQKRFPLILSDRKEHLELLYNEIYKNMDELNTKGYILTSNTGKRERNKILQEIKSMLPTEQCPFLLSTGSLIGEGFDLPELSTLFLAMPLSFKGRLIQYAGRLHRASSGKREVIIYDYIDKSLALGITMFRKRLTTYRKMGYTIIFADGSPLAKKVIKDKRRNMIIGNR
jgi:superfamily II DNA or RNA helicase